MALAANCGKPHTLGTHVPGDGGSWRQLDANVISLSQLVSRLCLAAITPSLLAASVPQTFIAAKTIKCSFIQV